MKTFFAQTGQILERLKNVILKHRSSFIMGITGLVTVNSLKNNLDSIIDLTFRGRIDDALELMLQSMPRYYGESERAYLLRVMQSVEKELEACTDPKRKRRLLAFLRRLGILLTKITGLSIEQMVKFYKKELPINGVEKPIPFEIPLIFLQYPELLTELLFCVILTYNIGLLIANENSDETNKLLTEEERSGVIGITAALIVCMLIIML